ncbi:MAG: NahK/ErcS family hybrid sensor histidine kinase/response regulator [Hyphomicrobiaceae bacterium]
MFEGWVIATLGVSYVGTLFLIAALGDRYFRFKKGGQGRPLIYALSLAVYCTSWTFFGSVGLAVATGYDFIPVYIGPLLMFTLGTPLILRVVRLAKSQNLTSVADFIAARYGKSQAVSAVVTLIAVIGSLPYIALQLKAVVLSVGTLMATPDLPDLSPGYAIDTALTIAVALAVFSVLFGTRHIDATEHQHGLMLAVAAESVVKLVAFLAVGIFVLFVMYGDPVAFYAAAEVNQQVQTIFSRSFNGGTWLTVIVLSFLAILLLPRQFHVTVVENNSETEIRRAAWLFPVYLVLINLFVVPIAAAGLMRLTPGTVEPDFFVLALPLAEGARSMALFVFVGGLSAAAAMVIVESVAIAIMVCNGLVVPLLLRYRLLDVDPDEDIAGLLLNIRRVAIFAIIMLGYGVYRLIGATQGLASLGLLSFAAIAQLAPAFLLGLVWRKGTSRGAIAGMLAGFAVWGYTLILPWIAKVGLVPTEIVTSGPFGLALLRPQALFFLEFEPLTHGVLWSLFANLTAYIAVSLLRPPLPIERLQAQAFIQDDAPRIGATQGFRLWRTTVTVGELQATAARYLGAERAERSFKEFAEQRGVTLWPHGEADLHILRFTEHLLTSAIGAASARLVLSLLLRRGNVGSQSALRLLDDATEALQYNRDLLQSALDQVRHGLGVFDKDLLLICWNRQFRELLMLPPELGRVGVPLERLLQELARRGDLGPGDADLLVAARVDRLANQRQTLQEQLNGGRRIVEFGTAAMPQGGIVMTCLDITDRVAAAQELERANETLERRVRERTAELLEVNAALAIAKSNADEANLDKTRFLAAASHDILQPLNAARLYATSLAERPLSGSDAALAHNVDVSLQSVEEILSALIDISRMDAGRIEPEMTQVPLEEMFDQLRIEFEPMAREEGLDLRIVRSTLWVRSDRRLLRRVLQNLVSNALKYTEQGRVVLGARRRGDHVVLQVVDSGPGIPLAKQTLVFKEFQRLAETAAAARGLGLGLSIVDRICRVLEAPIGLSSTVGRGSTFSVTLPWSRPRLGGKRMPASSATPMGPLSGCVTIVIDNEPTVLAGMETLLTGWGCHVASGATAAEALAALATTGREPDVILADYHLDSGTGIEAIDEVRARLGKEVPAIVITADHTPEVQRDLRLRGLSLLRKPLKAGALRALMTQHVLKRAVPAAE